MMTEAKRVTLVTGGAGFIGSHLVALLLEQGDRVIVLDDYSTGSKENLRNVADHPFLEVMAGSVTDREKVRELVQMSDRVFHLAAAVGVMLIIESPVRTIETNIRGTEIVLEECAEKGVKLLIASSSEVYGKSDKVPFSEEDDLLWGPTSRSRWSYACSKAADEFLALAYHREKALPVTVARLFNTVGPRQTGRYGMVIPRFVRQAADGGPITVYGDGTQTRCFAHVTDVSAALVKLIESPTAYGNVFNVGGETEVSIAELAETVRRRVNPDVKIETVPYEKAYEAGFEDLKRRVPDLSRIGREIGYRPEKGLNEILDDVIEEMKREREA